MGLYSNMFRARYSIVAPSVLTVAVSHLHMAMHRHATAAATCADMNGGN